MGRLVGRLEILGENPVIEWLNSRKFGKARCGGV